MKAKAPTLTGRSTTLSCLKAWQPSRKKISERNFNERENSSQNWKPHKSSPLWTSMIARKIRTAEIYLISKTRKLGTLRSKSRVASVQTKRMRRKSKNNSKVKRKPSKERKKRSNLKAKSQRNPTLRNKLLKKWKKSSRHSTIEEAEKSMKMWWLKFVIWAMAVGLTITLLQRSKRGNIGHLK